jgi:hypothetical protein
MSIPNLSPVFDDIIIDLKGKTAKEYIDGELCDDFRDIYKIVFRKPWEFRLYDDCEPIEVPVKKLTVAEPVRKGCRVYIDFSNISSNIHGFTINPEEFVKMLTRRCGDIQKGYIAGSFPDRECPYWDRWKKLYFDVRIHNKGKEMGVDETLHSAILNDLLQYPGSDIVIVTGDGNNEGWTSFPKCVVHALKVCRKVTLMAWKGRINSVFQDYVRYPNFEIMTLDSCKGELMECNVY